MRPLANRRTRGLGRAPGWEGAPRVPAPRRPRPPPASASGRARARGGDSGAGLDETLPRDAHLPTCGARRRDAAAGHGGGARRRRRGPALARSYDLPPAKAPRLGGVRDSALWRREAVRTPQGAPPLVAGRASGRGRRRHVGPRSGGSGDGAWRRGPGQVDQTGLELCVGL
ncbi:uncharacterized protein LOC101789300 isoform X2 [Cavia porcellus]|uniref:uncharacterized protein LOC101789300 isoform X2 n=1 Tax=Cavia porcellus TaxID=10141 RepID=UPI002FE4148F